MLFKEIVGVCCGNHVKHSNTLRGQNVDNSIVTCMSDYKRGLYW
jgi:hypothetical protein